MVEGRQSDPLTLPSHPARERGFCTFRSSLTASASPSHHPDYAEGMKSERCRAVPAIIPSAAAKVIECIARTMSPAA